MWIDGEARVVGISQFRALLPCVCEGIHEALLTRSTGLEDATKKLTGGDFYWMAWTLMLTSMIVNDYDARHAFWKNTIRWGFSKICCGIPLHENSSSVRDFNSDITNRDCRALTPSRPALKCEAGTLAAAGTFFRPLQPWLRIRYPHDVTKQFPLFTEKKHLLSHLETPKRTLLIEVIPTSSRSNHFGAVSSILLP